jgi:putative membrane protein
MASGRTGAVALVFGGLFELVQFRDPEALGALVPQLGGLGAVALVGIALTGVWWIGIVLAILQHHDFRLSMRGDALIAEGGLWVRRRVDLTGRRIQSVSARQGWIARRLGFWTFAVETAAAREGAGGLERAEAIVPVVDDPQALLARLAPDLGVDPWSADWRTASPRAAPRAVFAAAVRWSIPAAIATAWLGGGAAGLWLLPLWAGFVALRRVRAAGWLLTDRHILVRGGLMRRHVVWAPRSRVQAIHLRQGPWLRRLGLAIVDVRLAGSAVTLPLLELVDARAVLEALLGPTASEVAAPEGGAAPGAVG